MAAESDSQPFSTLSSLSLSHSSSRLIQMPLFLATFPASSWGIQPMITAHSSGSTLEDLQGEASGRPPNQMSKPWLLSTRRSKSSTPSPILYLFIMHIWYYYLWSVSKVLKAATAYNSKVHAESELPNAVDISVSVSLSHGPVNNIQPQRSPFIDFIDILLIGCLKRGNCFHVSWRFLLLNDWSNPRATHSCGTCMLHTISVDEYTLLLLFIGSQLDLIWQRKL